MQFKSQRRAVRYRKVLLWILLADALTLVLLAWLFFCK